MQDRFNRTIDYLRVSLTDRCNFRCVYCMPEQGFPCTPKEEHLRAEEIVRLVHIAADLGMRKVRLTGGEPLLRKDLPWLIENVRKHSAIQEVSLTTNGQLLGETASSLASAGLTRVNVSLDTLRGDRFTAIARRGSLDKVLEGIAASQNAGLCPIKINCVAMRGLNDDEAADFAAWTLRQEIHVRFIELMPMRWNLDQSEGFMPAEAHGGLGLLQIQQSRGDMLDDLQMRRLFVSSEELRARIEALYGVMGPATIATNGPARTYRIPGALGTIGFISQITNDFCQSCNRLRLTHDGFLRPCLMSDGELDLRTPLRNGASDRQLEELFLHVVAHKPERHYLAEGQTVSGRGMSQIGG